MPNDNKIFQSDNLLIGRTQIDTTTTIGYNPEDFEVEGNVMSLKSKTSYLSLVGADFTSTQPDVDDVSYTNATFNPSSAETPWAGVHLPHGAVVISAIVYGTGEAEDKTWALKRVDSNFNSNTMALANINTADTSISNATIDNSSYGYYLHTEPLGDGEIIWLAVIAYTTDYD